MKVDELKVGDRVKLGLKPDATGTVIWIQPDGWMDKWTREEVRGDWMLRLREACEADLRTIGVDDGVLAPPSYKNLMSCDRDKPRVIVRLDKRTTKEWSGRPAGSVRYLWTLPRSLRPANNNEEEAKA